MSELVARIDHARKMEVEAQQRALAAPAGTERWMHNAEAIRWLGVQLMLQKQLRSEVQYGAA